MWNALIRTDNDFASLVLRLTLGIVMFPHGAQKLLGWFGGGGFYATMNHFTANMGIPWILAFLVIVAEFFGAIALVAGFLTRLSAFGIGCVMIGAIVLVHWQFGFFMNWRGQQGGEGFEFHLLAIGITLALMIKGGGAASVDRYLADATVRS
jgi:putative oxidoreductase